MTFAELLKDVESDRGTLLYVCDLHWFSSGQILKEFFFQQVELFIDMKHIHVG